ncbi:MAG: RIP metalloprotease RseP [Flavobacteriaceae bacterium]|nr:RIP metalloprotease RseP [Flavobacteriaceae bacterium]
MDPVLIKVIQFFLSLSLLIVLHELGHFIPARLFGTRVEKFFLFFDIKFALFKKKIGETVYGIGWLPLGGYVKISGMIDESMDKEQMQQPPQPWEFRSKPAWQRLIIMLGGVTVNLILGVLIYIMIMFVWGKTIVTENNVPNGLEVSPLVEELGFRDGDVILSFDGVPLENLNDASRILLVRSPEKAYVRHADSTTETIAIPDDFGQQLFASGERPFSALVLAKIMSVESESPAEIAGLLPGDIIRGINGEDINSWQEVLQTFADYNKTEVALRVERDGLINSYSMAVRENNTIGIRVESPEISATELTYSFDESILEGIRYGYWTLYDYVAQFKFVFTKQGVSQLGGFGTIGSLFPGTWDWQAFWHTTALISIILAFMNVLPIPALDGGHVMFLAYEMITGRKPHDRVMEVAQMIGIFLLLGLFVYANANDLIRFLG